MLEKSSANSLGTVRVRAAWIWISITVTLLGLAILLILATVTLIWASSAFALVKVGEQLDSVGMDLDLDVDVKGLSCGDQAAPELPACMEDPTEPCPSGYHPIIVDDPTPCLPGEKCCIHN